MTKGLLDFDYVDVGIDGLFRLERTYQAAAEGGGSGTLNINVGSDNITSIYIGSTQVTAVYVGSTLVFGS